jgi:hypothetical protein
VSENTLKQHWVLVEGPAPGDAHFLGRWLLAAAESDKLLQDQFKRDPGFKLTIDRIELLYAFSFSPPAIKFTGLLMKNLTSFSVSVFELWGEVFAVMAEIGFFSQTGDRYQMTIPTGITREKIKAALGRLIATQDENDFLHPEYLVHCLSQVAVQDWQSRLARLPWTQRVADRNVLLEVFEVG